MIIKIMLTFCAFCLQFQLAYSQTYGLKFKGHEANLDERTELDLTPDKYITFKNDFEISFDFSLDTRNSTPLFGYILRIVNQENINIDLLTTPDPKLNLDLVIGKTNSILQVPSPDFSKKSWVNIRIKFLLSEDRLIFYMPDTFYVKRSIGFKKTDSFKFLFGANSYKQFQTTDVPPMSIKDVKIFEQGKLEYYWPLDETENTIAVDVLKKKEAFVKNPLWLKNLYDFWKIDSQIDVDGPLLVTADIETDRIFFIGLNELIIYSADQNMLKKIKYSNKQQFLTPFYSAIFNSIDKKIYCYLPGNCQVYSLNVETGEWSESGSLLISESNFRHHNKYFDPSNNSILIFGGYGFHQYKNEIRRINLSEHNCTDLQTDSSVFTPRYLGGLGYLKDTIYIFGGYGSMSGNQLVNPHSYFDLIGYSIKQGRLFKKFEVPRIVDDMVVANTMWIDETNRDYYFLFFEKTKFDGYLQLAKGNLSSPKIELLGDKLPFQFIDVQSSANLFYFPRKKKFFAFTSYLTNANITQSKICSISYPPNAFYTEKEKRKISNILFLWFFVVSITISLTMLYFLKVRKKKKFSEIGELIGDDSFQKLQKDSSIDANADENRYQIIFFGGFQVFDREYTDITGKFSPLMKELFLLIMLYSFKNNKGISSSSLTEILWFDKPEKSARNNRAVNIAKLRSLLHEIGSCDLTNRNSYWKLVFENSEIKSDYAEFLLLTASKNRISKEKIDKLLQITQKGEFLRNTNYQWLDEFKSSVADAIIDTLGAYAQAKDIKQNPEYFIILADSIFKFDPIDEEAMILKCKSQNFLGKHSLAKQTYDRFVKDYHDLYGQSYNSSFLEVMNEEN